MDKAETAMERKDLMVAKVKEVVEVVVAEEGVEAAAMEDGVTVKTIGSCLRDHIYVLLDYFPQSSMNQSKLVQIGSK